MDPDDLGEVERPGAKKPQDGKIAVEGGKNGAPGAPTETAPENTRIATGNDTNDGTDSGAPIMAEGGGGSESKEGAVAAEREYLGGSMKIALTGEPGVGKTSAIKSIINLLGARGIVCGGMLTESIYEDKKRVGFKIIDIQSKKEGMFAHVNMRKDIAIGKYGIDQGALENIGINALRHAQTSADIIVIDEIGIMELANFKFIEWVRKLLSMNAPLIMTLHEKSEHPLLSEIRVRQDLHMILVDKSNRDDAPNMVMALLSPFIFSKPPNERLGELPDFEPRP